MNVRSLGTARSCSAVVVASILLVPAAARSQDLAPATPLTLGAKVRIRAPSLSGSRIEGLIIETNETSLLLGINDRVPLRVPRQAITELDVGMGQHRQALKGAIIGAGAGLALFGLTAAAYAGDGSSTTSEWVGFLATGMAGGAVWGAGIGALIKADRWSPVPLERVHLSLGPTRGRGVSLSLSVRF